MDDEMIERVAKAIRLRDTTDEFAMAREAIKAIREPTDKMVNAGFNNYMYHEKNKLPWNGKTLYNAMIDCIIND